MRFGKNSRGSDWSTHKVETKMMARNRRGRGRAWRGGVIAAEVGVVAALLVALPLAVPAAATSAPSPVPITAPIITTLAGTVCCAPASGDGGPATQATLSPDGVAVDASGNVYASDGSFPSDRVREVNAATGIITTAVGNGQYGFSGDGGPANQAELASPTLLAIDSAGDLFISDSGNDRVREVNASTGIITTVAGNGTVGFSGDGGLATQAELNGPGGLAVDSSGDLYIGDGGTRIREVDASTGIITTIAGNGTFGFGGDGGPAAQAVFNATTGLAVDSQRNLYIADELNYRVRKIDAASGIITTVAGDGTNGSSGDGGPATSAELNPQAGLAISAKGDLLISDDTGSSVRDVNSAGIITTVAGGAPPSNAVFNQGPDIQNGLPATQAFLTQPYGLAVDTAGNLYIADIGTWSRIWVVGALSVATAAAPEPVPAGGPFAYAVTVGNFSPFPATQVNLTDYLPQGSTLPSANTPQGTCSTGGGVVTCALGTVAANSTVTVTIKLNAPGASEEGTAQNYATFTAVHPDKYSNDNTSVHQTTVNAPTLELAATASPIPSQVGHSLTYALTATNDLPSTASGVVLSDQLPPQVTFGTAAASQGTCSHSGHTVTCHLGKVPYQQTASVTITVNAAKAGIAINNATVLAHNFPVSAPASTDVEISSAACGQVISANTLLSQNIGPCAGDGVIIGANGITLDLGGHSIFGFPTPGLGTGAAVGVRLPMRSHVVIKNGQVSLFDSGIYINGGGHNTITNMKVHDNIGIDNFQTNFGDGILVNDSPANQIVANQVIHNGIFDGIGIFGDASNNNVVKNNTVKNTVGPSDGGPAGEGIIDNAFNGILNGAQITGTQIINNLVTGNGSGGIANVNSDNATVTNNTVTGNGFTNQDGNGIGVQIGFNPTNFVTNDLVQGNQVHGNGSNGLDIGVNGADGNRILNNDAAGNALNKNMYSQFFDLNDENRDANFNPTCANNVWAGNTFGSGGAFPACTTASAAATAQAASASDKVFSMVASPLDRPLARHLGG